MSGWPFGDLKMFGYSVLYADPAWRYENYSKAGEWKNADRHYDCMSLDEIAEMPVGQLARGDCVLFCWVTDPLLPEALKVIQHWGFTYRTIAFTWAKRTALDTGWHMGLGYFTRGNPEMCVLATIGSPGRPRDMGVRQLVVDPIREHSRKPDRIRSDIMRMYDGPYAELFSRTSHEGWDSWGNEVGKFDEFPGPRRDRKQSDGAGITLTGGGKAGGKSLPHNRTVESLSVAPLFDGAAL